MTTDRASALRLQRRSKESERKMGRWMIENDGPDPRFPPGGGLVTTTGRVGHVTGLQFDTLSLHYAGENKNQVVWAGLWGFWKKIVSKAREQGKDPLLRIEPSNEDRAGIPILHIITEERHAELLRKERWYDDEKGDSAPVVVAPAPEHAPPPAKRGLGYSKEQQAGRGRKPTTRRRR